jgi:hypothetical protein
MFQSDINNTATQGYLCSLENCVVLRNDLTSEDLSNMVSDLTDVGADEDAQGLFDMVEDDGLGNFTGHSVTVIDTFNYGRWVDRSENPVLKSKLQLNGHDRFQEREGAYFNYVQPYQHFSNTPADGVNVYSFALKPEDHQPSGTCNFSRIDNATLNVEIVDKNDLSDDSNLNIYTVNYNVLRVMSGMAGTAYSN